MRDPSGGHGFTVGGNEAGVLDARESFPKRLAENAAERNGAERGQLLVGIANAPVAIDEDEALRDAFENGTVLLLSFFGRGAELVFPACELEPEAVHGDVRADTSHKFARGEGLDEIVVGTGFEAFELGFFSGPG